MNRNTQNTLEPLCETYGLHPHYLWGFNGQERDDEVAGKGNSYTATFWQYDARLGRRWNVDPVPQFSISDYAVLGNNPMSNVDPDGAYFFGLIGSSSEQRKAAKEFKSKTGGTIINLHRKNLFVSYDEQVKFKGTPVMIKRTQYFSKNGGLIPQSPIMQSKQDNFYDDMQNKGGIIGGIYDWADDLYIISQTNPIGSMVIDLSGGDSRSPEHLNGDQASQNEALTASISGLSNAIPQAKFVKPMNAARFSQVFKGNLARLSAKARGRINRGINVVSSMYLNAKKGAKQIMSKGRSDK